MHVIMVSERKIRRKKKKISKGKGKKLEKAKKAE